MRNDPPPSARAQKQRPGAKSQARPTSDGVGDKPYSGEGGHRCSCRPRHGDALRSVPVRCEPDAEQATYTADQWLLASLLFHAECASAHSVVRDRRFGGVIVRRACPFRATGKERGGMRGTRRDRDVARQAGRQEAETDSDQSEARQRSRKQLRTYADNHPCAPGPSWIAATVDATATATVPSAAYTTDCSRGDGASNAGSSYRLSNARIVDQMWMWIWMWIWCAAVGAAGMEVGGLGGEEGGA